MRRFLLEDAKLELWTVLRLEQAFIDAVIAKDKDKLTSQLASIGLPDETKKMVSSFAGSLFTDVLSGLLTAAVSA